MITQRWSLKTRVLCRDSLKTWFFMSRCRLSLSLNTCRPMPCLGYVSSFHVSLCFMSHDCVLTVSLSGTAKCLFCDETLAFLAESRPLGQFTRCLLTYLLQNGCSRGWCCHGCKASWLPWQYLRVKHLSASQCRLSVINVLACLESCFGKCLCFGKMSWLHHSITLINIMKEATWRTLNTSGGFPYG